MEQDNPKQADLHRVRLRAILQQCPRPHISGGAGGAYLVCPLQPRWPPACHNRRSGTPGRVPDLGRRDRQAA
jgi:hypothetical protein